MLRVPSQPIAFLKIKNKSKRISKINENDESVKEEDEGEKRKGEKEENEENEMAQIEMPMVW